VMSKPSTVPRRGELFVPTGRRIRHESIETTLRYHDAVERRAARSDAAAVPMPYFPKTFDASINTPFRARSSAG
jgi:hypothetical protein